MKKSSTKLRKRYIITGSILLILVLIRIALPYLVLKYVNKTLAEMKGYYGHVSDIDIHLYRGAYQIDRLYINKVDSKNKKQTEFIRIKKTDLSVEWKALLNGAFVGELDIFSPKLVFTKNKTEIGKVAKDTNDFRKVLKSLMPLKVNRFEIHEGSIHYVDPGSSPKVDISVQELHIIASNLTNSKDEKSKLPSALLADGKAYDGTISIKMKLDALAKQPTFDLTADIKGANLVKLNSFLKAYGKFDVSKGTFGLYSEFAAEKGKFKGYVKPIIKDLKVVGPEDKKDGFFQKVKEALIGLAGNILKNPKKQQVATKIPIEGTFKDASVDSGSAIWEVLKNAFIEALMPSIDNEISIASVGEVDGKGKKKTFFGRLFSGKDEEPKKERSGLRKLKTTKN